MGGFCLQPLAPGFCLRHAVGPGFFATGSWRGLQLDGAGVLALSGVIGIFVGDTALFACMGRLGRGGSGILFASHALFSAVLAWLFLGETLSGWGLLGSALLVAGVMTAIAFGRRETELHHWESTKGRLAVGIALGLLAALGQSVATLMLKPLMQTGMDPVAASAVRMSSGLAAHAVLLFTRLARGAGHAVAALERPGISPLPAPRSA